MDVDLRRPSLADVFPTTTATSSAWSTSSAATSPGSGRSSRPTSRTSTSCPTGDTRDIPIEILGTLELRQLLIGLSNHYDRVILDGPAVLGLADCRMLGRIVDAALLVVRSGSHELRPLQRAKAMLEQSHVVHRRRRLQRPVRGPPELVELRPRPAPTATRRFGPSRRGPARRSRRRPTTNTPLTMAALTVVAETTRRVEHPFP